jgi:hypothetical protein
MNHFAVLTHNLSDLALTDKVPKKDKPIGKPHPRQDQVSFDTFQYIWPFVQGMARPSDMDDNAPISYTEAVYCGIVTLPTGA